MKKLLTSVNEMALTKPNDTHSTIYLKKNKKDGESIRDAVLEEISDTDSDDYTNKSHKHPSRNERDDEEMENVTDARGFFGDADMTLEEERIMDEEAYADSSEVQPSDQPNASNDTPSSPGDDQSSIPEEHLQV